MSRWSPDDLARLAGAQELEIASVRPDGTLRPYLTIWAGRIRAGGIRRDTGFVEAGPRRAARRTSTG